MPPSDPSPQSRERYFLRILAALIREKGGELRIKQSLLNEISGAGARQALFEDFDAKRQEVVLRFGSKLSAVYPFEGDGAPCPQVSTMPLPTPQTEPTTPLKSRPPLTDSALRNLEIHANRLANAARLTRETEERRKRQESSNPLDMIS